MKTCHREGCKNKLTKQGQKWCSARCSRLKDNLTSKRVAHQRKTRIAMTEYYLERLKTRNIDWECFVREIKSML